MTVPSILCPVDFSEASRGALRYAAAIAGHFGTRLLVLSVEDPLLTEAMDAGTGLVWRPEDSAAELSRFAAATLDDGPPGASPEYQVAVGRPAAEILRVSRERSVDLIVISSHGRTGLPKLLFGSTTERVLRETVNPVLVTPPIDPGPIRIEDAQTLVRRVLVPVDLSPASVSQVKAAARLAAGLNVGLVLANVIESHRYRLLAGTAAASHAAAEHELVVERRLRELLATAADTRHGEIVVAHGAPGLEIARIARARRAGLIVMGLHGSPLLGPRMGSVTYRVLCLVQGLVLAIPPEQAVRHTTPAWIGFAETAASMTA